MDSKIKQDDWIEHELWNLAHAAAIDLGLPKTKEAALHQSMAAAIIAHGNAGIATPPASQQVTSQRAANNLLRKLDQVVLGRSLSVDKLPIAVGICEEALTAYAAASAPSAHIPTTNRKENMNSNVVPQPDPSITEVDGKWATLLECPDGDVVVLQGKDRDAVDYALRTFMCGEKSVPHSDAAPSAPVGTERNSHPEDGGPEHIAWESPHRVEPVFILQSDHVESICFSEFVVDPLPVGGRKQLTKEQAWTMAKKLEAGFAAPSALLTRMVEQLDAWEESVIGFRQDLQRAGINGYYNAFMTRFNHLFESQVALLSEAEKTGVKP